MCISGICQIVGCDHELGSTAKEDNCGVCNGDGSSCRLVRGHYKSQLSTSKREDTVIVIPYGSRHVRLVLKGPDHLYLETKTLQGQKGENSLSTAGSYHIENTTVDFQEFPDKEILRMAGPLRADFTVKIQYASSSDSVVQFIFYQPIIHRWRETDFFPCSVTCGGGYQLTSAECFDLRSGRVVVDQYCHYYPENIKPKPKLRECNMDPCPASDGYKQIMPYDLYHPLPRWESSPWTACSTSCGGGIQSRAVSCVEEDIQGTITAADEWKCLYSAKIPILQPCNIFDCPKWLAQEWSPCTVTCGQGLRYRVVLCIDHRGLHAGGCNAKTKPHIKEECIVPVPCYKPKEKLPVEAKLPWFKQAQELEEETAVTEDPTFIPEPWSLCSRTCGAGTQRRVVRCQVLLSFSQTVADLPDDECEGPKPAEVQPCYRSPCAAGEGEEEEDVLQTVEKEELNDWEYEGFTQCSESCGGGLQEAVVICLNKQTREVTDENLCVSHRRPPQLLRACNTAPCPPRWEAGTWSSCSASCGVGLRSRSVACKHLQSRVNNETVTVSDDKCRLPKPSPVQACNRFDCPPMWEPQGWQRCSRSCGGGIQRREVLCKQRLSDGSVLELPETFCPSLSLPVLQPCETRECPAKWASVEWSQCSATCGEGTQRLAVVCRKQEENGEYITLNSTACSSLPQPMTVRACSLGPCGRSYRPGGSKHGPSILAQKKVYIQWRREKKLQFVIGGYAYLLPKTSVVIRCPVKRFRKSLIRWQKDGKPLASVSHLTVTSFGYIKIQHLKPSDSGIYSCMAGQAQENFVIKLIGSKQRVTVPDNLRSTATGKTLREPFILQDKAQPLRKHSQYDDIVLQLLELGGPLKENQDSGELLGSSEKNISFLEEDHSLEVSAPLTLVAEQWRLDEIIKNLLLQPEDLQGLYGNQLITQLLGELTKNQGESNESTLHYPERVSPDNTGPPRSWDSVRTLKERLRAPLIVQNNVKKDQMAPSEVVVHVGIPVLLHRWTNKLELRCEAVGNPEPAVSWSKNGKELVYGNRVEKLPDGSLKILAPSEADAGRYTCTARNSIGSVSLSSAVQLAEMNKMDNKEIWLLSLPPAPPQAALEDADWLALLSVTERDVHTLVIRGNNTTATLKAGSALLIGNDYSYYNSNHNLEVKDYSQCMIFGSIMRLFTIFLLTAYGVTSPVGKPQVFSRCHPLDNVMLCSVAGVTSPELRCLPNGLLSNQSQCMDGGANSSLTTETCTDQDCPLRWMVSPWSLCSRSCGGGQHSRRVSCHRVTAVGASDPLARDSCAGAGRKPPETQPCNTGPCVEWAASTWGQCQGQCIGPRLATQHRQVFCQNKNGTGLPHKDCSPVKVPSGSRNCSSESCGVQWRVSSWTQCTATCGSHGFQSRQVVCIHQRSGKPARELHCSWSPRPANWQRCNIIPCTKAECQDTTRYCEKVKQLKLCQLVQFKVRCCDSCRDT
ncbi:ATL1 protein, partial [Amia calva]|nr:ATL1 protein [Amia calva]